MAQTLHCSFSSYLKIARITLSCCWTTSGWKVKLTPLFFPLLAWGEPKCVHLLMTLLSLGNGRVLWGWQKSLSPARWDRCTVVRSPVKAVMHERFWKSIFKPQGRSDNAGWRHHVQLGYGVTASERWESFILNYQVFTAFKNRFFHVLLQPLLHVSAKLKNTNWPCKLVKI